MKIAIIGTRGIPNNYGGFEQLAQFLADGLSERGHQVIVYNSHNHPYREKTWNKVQIVHRYDPEKSIGTAGQFVYDLNCILHARKESFDIILNLGYTSSSVWMWLFPDKAILITNMDGMEWKRSKYSGMVQRFLKVAERLAVKGSDLLVADSVFISEYLSGKYKVRPAFVAYGAQLFADPDVSVLSRFGLKPYGYNMLVARMEPENNIELILEGVATSGSDAPFIVVGHAGNHFGEYLKNRFRDTSTIIFAGAIYDPPVINNLRYHCQLYFHGHSVGGTNPSLLEAMGCRSLIAAHDNGFNRSVLGEEAYYFSTIGDIHRVLKNCQRHSEISSRWLSMNYDKIEKNYSWPRIVSEYESLMIKHLKPGS